MLGRHDWRAWVQRAPVLLLIAIALLQVGRAHFGHLVAWKGGGFGMFATIDAPDFREVRLFDARGHPLAIPADLAAENRRVRSYPDRAAISTLSRTMQSELSERRVARAEVWRTEFSGRPLRPYKTLLLRVDVAEP